VFTSFLHQTVSKDRSYRAINSKVALRCSCLKPKSSEFMPEDIESHVINTQNVLVNCSTCVARQQQNSCLATRYTYTPI